MREDNYSKARFLLEKGRISKLDFVNVQEDSAPGEFPLHAVKSSKLAQLLLDHNADVRRESSQGECALFSAIRREQVEVCTVITRVMQSEARCDDVYLARLLQGTGKRERSLLHHVTEITKPQNQEALLRLTVQLVTKLQEVEPGQADEILNDPITTSKPPIISWVIAIGRVCNQDLFKLLLQAGCRLQVTGDTHSLFQILDRQWPSQGGAVARDMLLDAMRFDQSTPHELFYSHRGAVKCFFCEAAITMAINDTRTEKDAIFGLIKGFIADWRERPGVSAAEKKDHLTAQLTASVTCIYKYYLRNRKIFKDFYEDILNFLLECGADRATFRDQCECSPCRDARRPLPSTAACAVRETN